MLERGFTANESGKIIDDMGNEYRDEQGQVCYLKKEDCNHSEYNPECITCRDIETHAGFDFKNGNFNEVDSWQAKVDHYNKPEPMEDEPSEDDYADRITDNEIQDRLEADIINMVNEEKV